MPRNRAVKTVAVLIFFSVASLLLYSFYFQFFNTPRSSTVSSHLIIVYDDGSEEVAPLNAPPPAAISPPPQHSNTIWDTSYRRVVAVRLELYATVQYTGEATCWSSYGEAVFHIINLQTGATVADIVEPLNNVGDWLPRGELFTVYSLTMSSDCLEATLSNYLPPRYYPSYPYALQLNVEISFFTLAVTFIEGTTRYASTSNYPTASWNFLWLS